jgi:hypothetical protein
MAGDDRYQPPKDPLNYSCKADNMTIDLRHVSRRMKSPKPIAICGGTREGCCLEEDMEMLDKMFSGIAKRPRRDGKGVLVRMDAKLDAKGQSRIGGSESLAAKGGVGEESGANYKSWCERGQDWYGPVLVGPWHGCGAVELSSGYTVRGKKGASLDGGMIMVEAMKGRQTNGNDGDP